MTSYILMQSQKMRESLVLFWIQERTWWSTWPFDYLLTKAIEVKCWLPVNQQLLSIPSVKTSGCHYMFPESELKYMQKQFTENLWTWKHSLHLHSMQLPIEICCSTSNTLIIIENLWKHLTLIHIKASFFVVYTVIPGYFDEFVHEIMKWNISKIKHNSYEVLNLQVYLIILVLTHGNL